MVCLKFAQTVELVLLWHSLRKLLYEQRSVWPCPSKQLSLGPCTPLNFW